METIEIKTMPQYYEIEFDADGGLERDDGLRDAVATGKIHNLFVFSHGWNCSARSARSLYKAMFILLADLLGKHLPSSAAVGIIWPSLLFPEDDPTTPTQEEPFTGAEITAAVASAFPDRQQADLKRIGELLDEQPPDEQKLKEFCSLVRGLVTTKPQGEEDAGESTMLTADPLAALSDAESRTPREDGAAQGLPNPFTLLWNGGKELLRTASYYEMKNRAGVIGQKGLGPLLGDLTEPPRIHLIGHSFGARLVAYTLAGLPATCTGKASPVKSLTLIQGAFSHFAFAPYLPFDGRRSGALTGFTNRVDGPLLATFSEHDRAVSWWYPAASWLNREDAQGAANVAFRWGAMGYDGFKQDPKATEIPLAKVTDSYSFTDGAFYALESSGVIQDQKQSILAGAHCDIRHPAVLWAVASAARLT